MSDAKARVIHCGGCHCGGVRFEVEAPARITAQACNCSMCSMTGFLHLIVGQARFRLICGQQLLTEYTFNTGVAKHRFCSRCGIKSFYVPRSNPDGISVSVRCIDHGTLEQVTVEDFDGQNWEAHAPRLLNLSRD